MPFIASAAAASMARPPGGSTGERAATVYSAGPLDQINAWVAQWGTSRQVLGGTILAICMVLVGIKLGAKSVAGGGGGATTGRREAFGAIFGLAIAGILIGAALIVVPLLLGIGSNSGNNPRAESRRRAG